MILDTNILIAYLDGETSVAEKIVQWKQEGRGVFVSSISIAEILSLSLLTPTEVEKIKSFLGNFVSVAFDEEIAEATALFRRKYHLELPDAAIAATAFTQKSPLVTRDHQFRKIQEITVIEI